MTRAADLPLLRTWKVGRFRVVAGLLLIAAGLIMTAVFVRVLDDVQPQSGGYDPLVFLHAAERLGSTGSPFMESQLEAPIELPCTDCYLYPPPFAQAFTPLAAVPSEAVVAIWLLVQALAMFAALWLATGLGGVARGLERAIWCVVALLWFAPVFASLWFGNVSTLLALSVTLVAMGGTAAGAGAAVGVFVKFTPIVLVPATLASGHQARRSFAIVSGLVVALSFVAAPNAWLDYVSVLVNLLLGSADDALQFAPATVARQSAVPDWAVLLVRVLTIVIAFCCVAGSVWAARKADGMRFAALLGTVAMLLVPGTLWYHYFAVLLPFAAMAWPRLGVGGRASLLASAASVYVGLGSPIVVLAGALVLVVVSGHALRPAATS